MSRKMSDLKPGFRAEVKTLLKSCKDKGVETKPFFTLRTPEEQARLWRQSRSTQEVKDAIASLDRDGAPYLAKVLRDVGPHYGQPVTNALPGNSWHQWGKACDCYWLVETGKAEWSSAKKITLPDGTKGNGYRIYADLAKAQRLTAGGFWTSPKDWPHVQQHAESSPCKLQSWPDIEKAMKKKFGEG